MPLPARHTLYTTSNSQARLPGILRAKSKPLLDGGATALSQVSLEALSQTAPTAGGETAAAAGATGTDGASGGGTGADGEAAAYEAAQGGRWTEELLEPKLATLLPGLATTLEKVAAVTHV